MATRTISNSGGTRNWNDTASWVEAAVPTSADDVVATGTSGTLTINVAAACRSIDLTGYTSTLTHASGILLSVGDASGGALKFVAGMTYTLGHANSSATEFISTSNNGGTGWSITTGGKVFGNVTFGGAGGKWVLQDTLGISNSRLSFTFGELVTNNQTLNIGDFPFGGSTGTRVLTMGSSAINVQGGGNAVDMFNSTGLTITSNTAVMTFTNGYFRSQTANVNFNGLSLVHTGNGTAPIDPNGATFANVTHTGAAAPGAVFNVAGPFTVTGTLTLTGNNATTNRLTIKSTTPGTYRTITANGTVTHSNTDYIDITRAGSATWPNLKHISNAGGNWNATAAWTEGAVPTSSDDVVATATSGNLTVNAANLVAHDVDFTNYTGTFTWNDNTSLLIGNGWKFVAGMTVTYPAGNQYLTFVATYNNGGLGWNITTAGKGMPHTSVNGVGGKWVLQDTYNTSNTNVYLNVNNGTLDTNNQTLNIGRFYNNHNNASTFTMGSSTINVQMGFNPPEIAWQDQAPNMVITANTATINLTGTGGTPTFWISSTKSGYSGTTVVFPVAGTGVARHVSATGSTIAALSYTGSAGLFESLYFDGNITITGTLTLAGNSVINRPFIQSNVLGTPRTVTVNGTVTASNVDFMDITGAGSASWNLSAITGGSGDGQGNSGITFTTPVTRYAVVAGNFSSTATWSTSSGGAGGATAPLPQDTAILNASSAAGTYTANMPRIAKDLDFTGFTRSFNMGGTAQDMFGSLTLGSGMTGVWNRQLNFRGRGSHTITTNGIVWTAGWNFHAYGGTYTLQDNVSFSGTSGAEWQFGAGTLDTNGKTVSIPAFLGNFVTTGPKTLTLGTSTINLYDTATTGGQGFGMWDINGAATVSAASSTIAISSASANSRTFHGGGKTYGTLKYNVAASTGALVIDGANTFTTINVSGGTRTITLPTAVTTTVTNWNVDGATVLILNGTASNYFSTPDSTAFTVGDFELRVKAALTDWTPAATNELFNKDTGSDPQRAFALRVLTTGIIRLLWWDQGTTLRTMDSTVAPTVADGATLSLKVTVDVSNGSLVPEVTFYTSINWDPEADTGTWTILGSSVVGAGTVTALNDTTGAAGVGARTADGTNATTGTIYYAEFRNGIGGTVTAKFNPANVARTAARTPTSFVSSTGETWTGTGAAWDWSDVITLNSSSVGSTTTQLTKAGGGQVSSRNIAVKDSTATPVSTWYAYPNGINKGNNSGWRFYNPATPSVPESGLHFWYAADSGGLFQDSAHATAVAANNDPVGAWDDVSGSGVHVVQATTTKRPLYQTGGPNSKPYVRGDGVDDYLSKLSVTTWSGSATYFMVARGGGVTPSSQYWICQGGNNSVAIIAGFEASGMVEYFNSGVGGWGSALRVNVGTSDGTTWAIYAFNDNSASNAKGYKNGSLTESLTGLSQNWGDRMYLFAAATDASWALADFAEIIIYDRTLTLTEMNTVGNYLESKYALTWTDLTANNPISVGAAVGLSTTGTGPLSFGSGDM